MKTITNIIKTILLLTIFSSSIAEDNAFEEAQYDSELQILAVTPNPSALWDE